MVKNTTGGKRTKSGARKNLTKPVSNFLRTSSNDLEIYGCVTKLLGNNMFEVLCMDDKIRKGVIRGKFSGRGKRDNFIGRGTWVLIGLREWEMQKPGSNQSCDLMEVYTDRDKDLLKSRYSEVNWKLFNSTTASIATISEEDDNLFMNDQQEEFYNIMQTTTERSTVIAFDNDTTEKEIEEEVSFDDI